MFERMEIAGYIYKGVVEPYYKKTTRAGSNRAGHSSIKRGEYASSNTSSVMSESADKGIKICVYYPKGKSKPSCLIHPPRAYIR